MKLAFGGNRYWVLSIALVSSLLLVEATVSQAATIPAVSLTVGEVGSTVVLNPAGVDNLNGTFDYDGVMTANPDWDLEWDMTVDPDPFVSAGFTFTNNTAVTSTFTVSVVLPIAPPINGPTLIGGSTTVGVTDANFDGVGTLATAAPTAYYRAILTVSQHCRCSPIPSASRSHSKAAAMRRRRRPAFPDRRFSAHRH